MRFTRKHKKQLSLLWGKVGFIVELSQMVEYNLANILASHDILKEFDTQDSLFVIEYNEFAERANKLYTRLCKFPLGKIIEQAEKVKYFNEDGLQLLGDACKKRNFVVHHLFREDLTKQHLETNPTFYFEELEETIALLHAINEVLVDIFAKQKEEFKLIY